MRDGMTTFPYIEVAGDAKSRGFNYGTALRDSIVATWQYYRDTVFTTSKLSRGEITQRAKRIRELIGDFNPDYCTEIEAIAEAAGLAAWEVYALNARTEILNAVVGECTAVYLPDSRVLGQTWDWLAALENLVAITKYTDLDGDRIVTLAEPGQLAKIGLNSSGIGVCLNFLVAPHALEGVPVHVLIRALLECRDLADARRTIARAGHGKASHFLIADAHGDALSYEFAGSRSGEVPPVDGVYAHTNHCIAPTRDPRGYVIPTSVERLAAARAQAAQRDESSVEAMKRILSYDDDTPSAINVRYRPEPLLGGDDVGSCATLIMDLPARELHVRKGPNPMRPFIRIAV
jgi:isopenicillin-N N-acyltransferase like protein